MVVNKTPVVCVVVVCSVVFGDTVVDISPVVGSSVVFSGVGCIVAVGCSVDLGGSVVTVILIGSGSRVVDCSDNYSFFV